MQDGILIKYEVYQNAYEMWQVLKEKYGGLSATKQRKLVMKFGNYKMWLNHTMKQHLKEMKKNEESLRHLSMSSLVSNKLRRSSNLYQRVGNRWWWTWHIMRVLRLGWYSSPSWIGSQATCGC